MFRFIKENQNRYYTREMARVLGVSPATYYAWEGHGLSTRQEWEDKEALKLIREIVKKHNYQYGAVRVKEELKNKYDKEVHLRTVTRLMKENGLNAHRKKES